MQLLSGDADLRGARPAQRLRRSGLSAARALARRRRGEPGGRSRRQARRSRRRAAHHRRRCLPRRRRAAGPDRRAPATASIICAPTRFSSAPPRRARLASTGAATIAFQVGLRTVTLHVAGLLPGGSAAALRSDGHRRRAGAFRSAGPRQPRRPSARGRASTSRPRASEYRRSCPPGLPFERPEASVAAQRRPVPLLPRQPERARAGRAVHRRPAGVLDAGARGRAPPRAVGAAARARHDAPAAGDAARARRRAVGIVGSALGLAAGFVACAAAVRVIGADLGAGYFRGVHRRWRSLRSRWRSSSALGVAVAVLGSLVPALEAARAAPAPALKAGDEERAFARLAPVVAGRA